MQKLGLVSLVINVVLIGWLVWVTGQLPKTSITESKAPQVTETESNQIEELSTESDMSIELPKMKKGQIVFVNTDTLFEKYELFKSIKGQLEKKNRTLETDLGNRLRKLESEMIEAQQRAQAGGYTPNQMRDKEQEMMRKQEELAEYKATQAEKLMDEERKLNKQLMDAIKKYMNSFGPENNLNYVLGYSEGGGILYAVDSLDITKQVLQGLNKQYRQKK
jgi:outer membrane protein